MEKAKKPTNSQLQKRLDNAVLHIDKTKDTQTIFFDDKGLRLTVDDDYAIIETGYHRHIYSSFTSSGVSRPYLYTKRFVGIALENADKAKDNDGYSYKKLLESLKNDDSKADEYNIAIYCDMFFFSIFQNLYLIGENSAECFMVYLSYVCGIARNAIMLDEHKDGMTDKQFVEKFRNLIGELTEKSQETMIFEPISDEQRMQDAMDAITEQEDEDFIKQQIAERNGNQD